jgi:nitrogen fixation/metabolism regulation signal transduction histidine kinase
LSLKPKLLLFALIALVVPVLSILLFSAIAIYKNDLVSHWRYLDQTAELIVTDIKETEKSYLSYISEFVEDEYIKTKLYVHAKYRNYLSDSAFAWDLVPLRDFVSDYSLTHSIETVSVYESFSSAYKRVLYLGNSTNVPYTIEKDIDENKFRYLFYDQFLNCLYVNFLRPVYSDEKITGLILFQRAFDNEYFYNFTLKHDIDLAVVVDRKIAYSSSNGHHRESVESMIESRAERSYFRSKDVVFQMVMHPVDFGRDFSGAIVTISKGNSIIRSGGSYIIKLSIIGIAAIVIAVVLFYIWGLELIKTIQSLFVGTNEVSRGNFEYQLSVSRKDELGMLAHNFNQMVCTIRADKDNLEKKNKELQLMNYYIDAVFQSLEVNTIVIDGNHSPVLMNDNAKNKLNLQSNRELKDIFSFPFFSNKAPFFRQNIDEVFRTGNYKNIQDIKIDDAFYAVDLFPIKDTDDGVSGVIIIIINVTDREIMKQELLKSQKIAALGQVSASLAHELNNPIGIILNHVELLQSKKLTEEEEATFLDRIHSGIVRINKLIENLLQFSRNEMMETKTTDVYELILQVFEIFSPICQRNGILYEITNNADSCIIHGNATLLKQLFLNLVKNAIESIQHIHGNLDVTLSNNNKALIVDITDNGRGMHPSVVQKIFDPFFTSKAHPNIGLGLSLCKEIVEKHRGTIDVASSEDNGTKVTITLPFGESL